MVDWKARFRFMRKVSGHTQESLSRRSGITRKTISQLEGKRDFNPKIETLSALVEACDKDLGWFFLADQENDDPVTASAISQVRFLMAVGGEWGVTCEKVLRSIAKSCAEERFRQMRLTAKRNEGSKE